MKRIGIDARLLSKTGVGVYVKNLLLHLQDIVPGDWYFFVYLRSEDFGKITFKNKNFVKRKANFKWHSMSEQFEFLRTLKKDGLDLMHFTYLSYPISYRGKFISTIHDLTHLLFKSGEASTKSIFIYKLKYFFLKIVLYSQINFASAIITPTKTVKKQILDYYGSKFDKKIFPIYEGIDEDLKRVNENKSLKKLFSGNFFIYVGNFYPHKNVENLLRAFSKTKNKYKLILVGPEDYFSKRIVKLTNDLNQKGRIIFYKNPKLADLVFFYKNAKALINPSFSEGFGLTLIEASYFRLPIIASDIPVFKEVFTDQYLSFNPKSIADIVKKLEQFIKQKKKLMVSDVVRKYSFRRMAKKTSEVYKKCLDIA